MKPNKPDGQINIEKDIETSHLICITGTEHNFGIQAKNWCKYVAVYFKIRLFDIKLIQYFDLIKEMLRFSHEAKCSGNNLMLHSKYDIEKRKYPVIYASYEGVQNIVL